ncbi:Sulfite oxidase [Labilithrix luteola]|uniref:Sulfite oxidase n=1 Tax=Labilithrix luteola TaxID=1391654 RepID=A0A0K1PRY5_9BACT|nr:molybdopterin-dependent oxidoreductase [Labilithrix luteola]AKU96288.1 Sulfite oxidase [Labilithrix luteola]
MSSRILGRRALLTGLAASTVACDTERPHEGGLGAMERWNARVQQALFSETKLAADPGPEALTPFVHFPVYFVSESLPVAPPNWHLRVGGMVARPQDLSLADLQRLTRIDVRFRHHCVEGWSAVAAWHGLSMRALAELVGVDPAAKFVEFRSFDSGYSSSWDIASALHPQTILAYGMNGDPLEAAHGAPLRLYSAIKLGYKSVKYLTEVLFLPTMTGGYWEDRGYEWFAGT